MITISNTISSEIIKTRHTAIPWLLLIGAAFIPLLLMAMYLMNPAKISIAPGENSWHVLVKNVYQFASVFVIPLFVMLAASLVVNVEFKSNTWKHLLVLPVAKDFLFIGKLLLMVGVLLLFYACFIIFILVDGLVFSKELLQFHSSRSAVDWTILFKLSTQSFVSVLPILAIQFWLSLRIKNIVVVIGIGLMALFMAIVLASPGTWEHVYLFPYSYPALMSYRLNNAKPYPDLSYSLFAVVAALIILLGCYIDFKRNFRG